jgi:ribosomal protein L16/L10AE
MNNKINDLAVQAGLIAKEYNGFDRTALTAAEREFARLIVEQCRQVLTEVYRKTPLECAGYLLGADEEIAEYFYCTAP